MIFGLENGLDKRGVVIKIYATRRLMWIALRSARGDKFACSASVTRASTLCRNLPLNCKLTRPLVCVGRRRGVRLRCVRHHIVRSHFSRSSRVQEHSRLLARVYHHRDPSLISAGPIFDRTAQRGANGRRLARQTSRFRRLCNRSTTRTRRAAWTFRCQRRRACGKRTLASEKAAQLSAVELCDDFPSQPTAPRSPLQTGVELLPALKNQEEIH